jgi:hypothetical protein
MPFALEQLTQALAFLNGVVPQSLNNSRASTAGVDMSVHERALFVLYIGAVTAGSLSAWLQESSDNFSSDVPSNDAASSFSNSAGSYLSATGLTTSSSLVTFEVRAGQLTAGKRHVRLQVKEVNGSAVPVCVLAIGSEAHPRPARAAEGNHAGTNGAHYVVA